MSKSVSTNDLARSHRRGAKSQTVARKAPAVSQAIADDLYNTAISCIFVPVQGDHVDYLPQKLVSSFRDSLGMDEGDHNEMMARSIGSCTFEVPRTLQPILSVTDLMG
jgi:hypothetical protein